MPTAVPKRSPIYLLNRVDLAYIRRSYAIGVQCDIDVNLTMHAELEWKRIIEKEQKKALNAIRTMLAAKLGQGGHFCFPS